jgi:snapalysin
VNRASTHIRRCSRGRCHGAADHRGRLGANRRGSRDNGDIWNTSVTNVRIVKATAGQRVNIRVVADNGWPRANLGPVRPSGSVTVWMGRQAVSDGYNVVRIAAHELGHSLGLPDVKPGPCSSLMSGSTGGVSCNSLRPNAAEASRVQRNYAGTLKTQDVDTSVVLEDAAY